MNEENFVAYEYLSINVKSDMEPMYMDCYENFGWIPANVGTSSSNKRDYYINSNANIHVEDLINLKFKRDRKIKNKSKLQPLQRKCEQAFQSINKLEKEPASLAISYALAVALIGCVFLAISVFCITGKSVIWIPAILCGAVGIIGWIIPYFLYKNTKNKKTTENSSLIEEQYDIIYNCCEEAKKLLNE